MSQGKHASPADIWKFMILTAGLSITVLIPELSYLLSPHELLTGRVVHFTPWRGGGTVTVQLPTGEAISYGSGRTGAPDTGGTVLLSCTRAAVPVCRPPDLESQFAFFLIGVVLATFTAIVWVRSLRLLRTGSPSWKRR